VRLASLVTATVIHNNGGLDPAIVAATPLAAENWWRPESGLLRANALAIAVPALFFFLAANLAIANASLSCRPRPRTRA
jgi:hypothetical protein